MHEEWVIGVDVGGTKVAAGFVNALGEMGTLTRTTMNPRGTAAEGLAAVTEAIDALRRASPATKVERIGICAPGPLDPASGIILNPPNVPCWRDFPLGAEIAARYRVRSRIENDANAATLAESLWGAGRGYRNVFYACIGTGIGTGLVQGGRIYGGRTGSALEGGHVTIDFRGPQCACGKLGCIEALASGPAIARRGREAAVADSARAVALAAAAQGDLQRLRSEMIGRAAAAGDALAQQVIFETLDYLAVWLGNIVDLLEPDVMILGGGVAQLLQPYFGELQTRMKKWCVNGRCAEIPLVPAHYGENAGVAGGAALCYGEQR